jgi:hypothetical protein
MKCPQVHDQLTEYIKGTLDKNSALEITSHVADCPNCARELSFFKEYLQNLSAMPQAQAPAEFLSGVRKRLNEMPKTTSRPKKIFGRFSPVPGWAIPICAGVLILICGMSWWRFSNLWQNPVEFTQINNKELISAEPLSVPASNKKTDNRESVDKGIKREEIRKIQIALQVKIAHPFYEETKSAFSAMGKSMDAETRSSEQTYKLAEEEISAAPKADDRISANMAPLETQLKDLIEKNNGKIIGTENDSSSQLLKKIRLQVPGENYTKFITGLNQIGEIKQLTPEPSPVDNVWLEAELNFLHE